MPNAVYLNVSQIHQIQVEDGQSSPGDGSSGDSPPLTMGLNLHEFFAPPLPFDGELLDSVKNLTNSMEWDGMAVPGMHYSLRL
jgi:hypothetical protein